MKSTFHCTGRVRFFSLELPELFSEPFQTSTGNGATSSVLPICRFALRPSLLVLAFCNCSSASLLQSPRRHCRPHPQADRRQSLTAHASRRRQTLSPPWPSVPRSLPSLAARRLVLPSSQSRLGLGPLESRLSLHLLGSGCFPIARPSRLLAFSVARVSSLSHPQSGRPVASRISRPWCRFCEGMRVCD